MVSDGSPCVAHLVWPMPQVPGTDSPPFVFSIRTLRLDRLEAQSWARHYQQIAREEKEAELADDMEKGLPQHLFESLCIDHLQRHGASKKAITRAFDDDVEFQERMAEHIRYMVETIAHHQVDIDSEV